LNGRYRQRMQARQKFRRLDDCGTLKKAVANNESQQNEGQDKPVESVI
jgi:hypothetical protein